MTKNITNASNEDSLQWKTTSKDSKGNIFVPIGHTQNGNLNLGDQTAMEDDLKISKVEYLKGNITATTCQILSKSEAYF